MHALPSHQTFRPHKKILHQGIGFSIFFLAALLFHTSVPFLPDPNGRAFAKEGSVPLFIAMGVGLWGPMLLLALAAWRSYYVERLTLEGTTVRFRSLWRTRELDLAEIQSLRWRDPPRGGAVQLRGPGHKMRFDLNNYSEADRLRIVLFFRQAVPPERQEAWPRFCHRVALPLRDGVSASDLGLTPGDQTQAARHRRNLRNVVWSLFALPLLVAVLRGAGFDLFIVQIVAVVAALVLVILILTHPYPTPRPAAQQQQLAVERWEQGEANGESASA